MKLRLTANRAWGVIGIGVLLYEIVANDGELLSEGADRALEAHPILTRLGVVVVALHLINALPARFDPVHRLVGLRRPLSHREAAVVREAERILVDAAAGK